jgi:hypothetical protein
MCMAPGHRPGQGTSTCFTMMPLGASQCLRRRRTSAIYKHVALSIWIQRSTPAPRPASLQAGLHHTWQGAWAFGAPCPCFDDKPPCGHVQASPITIMHCVASCFDMCFDLKSAARVSATGSKTRSRKSKALFQSVFFAYRLR